MNFLGEMVCLNKAGTNAGGAIIQATVDLSKARVIKFAFTDQTVAARVPVLVKFYPIITEVVSLKWRYADEEGWFDTGLGLSPPIESKQQVIDLVDNLMLIAREAAKKRNAARGLDVMPAGARPDDIINVLDLRKDVVGVIDTAAEDVDEFISVADALTALMDADYVLKAGSAISEAALTPVVAAEKGVVALEQPLVADRMVAIGSPLSTVQEGRVRENLKEGPYAVDNQRELVIDVEFDASKMRMREIDGSIVRIFSNVGTTEAATGVYISSRGNNVVTVGRDDNISAVVRDKFKREASNAIVQLLALASPKGGKHSKVKIAISLVFLNDKNRRLFGNLMREVFFVPLAVLPDLHIDVIKQYVYDIHGKYRLEEAQQLYKNQAYSLEELFGAAAPVGVKLVKTESIVNIEIEK